MNVWHMNIYPRTPQNFQEFPGLSHNISTSKLGRFILSGIKFIKSFIFGTADKGLHPRNQETCSISHREVVSEVELETRITTSKPRVFSVAPQLSPSLFNLMKELKQAWPVLSRSIWAMGWRTWGWGVGLTLGVWKNLLLCLKLGPALLDLYIQD